MSRFLLFAFGLALGGLALFGAQRAGYLVGHDWLASARGSTRPGRRVFTLPLNNPDVVPASAAQHMRPEDVVVGVFVGEHVRAYPWWIIGNYHVVNDTFEGPDDGRDLEVCVTYCDACGGAAAWSAVVDVLPRRPLAFQISGVRTGTFEMSDVQTHTKWHPFTGKAVEGPLEGTLLRRLPAVVDRWGTWVAAHPETEVVFGTASLRQREHGLTAGEPGDHDLNPIMAATANLDDERLERDRLVFGIMNPDATRGVALPHDVLRQGGVLELTLFDTPMLIVATAEFRVQAFERRVGDEVLSFELAADEPLRLRDAGGSVWDAWGRAVEGPRAGERLHIVGGYLTEWFEWVSGFPDTTIWQPSAPAGRGGG